MHLWSSFLFGLSSNTDNLVIGFSYGIRKISITGRSNLLIGLISLAGTVLSMFLGKSFLFLLPPKVAGILGSSIIMVIGAAGFIRYLRNKNKNTGTKNTPALPLPKVLLLGFALAVNNIGLGIGASITGLEILPTAVCSFMISLLFLDLGNRIGRSKRCWVIGRFAEPLANLMMIALGIYELFI